MSKRAPEHEQQKQQQDECEDEEQGNDAEARISKF